MKIIAITQEPSTIHFSNGHSLITEITEQGVLSTLQNALPSNPPTSVEFVTGKPGSLSRVKISNESVTSSKSATDLNTAIISTVNKFIAAAGVPFNAPQ